MKKIFGLLIVFCCVFFGYPAVSNSADYGVYVAPKFMFDVPQGNYLSKNGSGEGGSYRDTTGVGGALALGYDFNTVYDLPFRAELEYALRTDATFEYDNRDRVARTPQTIFANFYVDFHNETPFTPYMGGGVGMGIIGENTNFAWNVGGGVAYNIVDDWDIDLGYRYASLGQFESRHTKGLYSTHEVTLGLRYTF